MTGVRLSILHGMHNKEEKKKQPTATAASAEAPTTNQKINIYFK